MLPIRNEEMKRNDASMQSGKVFPISWKIDQQQQQQQQCANQDIVDSTASFQQNLPQYYAMAANTSANDMSGFRVRQHPPPPYLHQSNQYTLSHAPSPIQQPNAYPNGYQPYAGISNHPAMVFGNDASSGMIPKPIRKRRRPPHSYASLIAQAILTSPERRLTLRDIYDWIQSRYPNLYEANETGWQNTIRHNLSLNRCFMKLPRTLHNHGDGRSKKSKGSYWSVDLEKLSYTNFGRQIMDAGFLGNIEYWQHQQMIEEQRQQQSFQQRQCVPSVQHNHSTLVDFNVDSFIDVNGGTSSDQQHTPPAKRHASGSICDNSVSPVSTASSNMSTPMVSSSSSQIQTYNSMLPNPIRQGDMIDSNGTANNNNNFKFDQDNALYPSLMRVNNIIN